MHSLQATSIAAPRPQVSMLQSQEINSTAQYSFRTSDRLWRGTHCSMNEIIYSTNLALFTTGLRQPRERMKFGQWYLSEKVALSF